MGILQRYRRYLADGDFMRLIKTYTIAVNGNGGN